MMNAVSGQSCCSRLKGYQAPAHPFFLLFGRALQRAFIRPKNASMSAQRKKNKGRHIMLALEERKPFHKIETIVSIGSQKRPEVNARRSKGNRRRAPKVFFLIRWCWRGSLVERIENVKSWIKENMTARSLLNVRKKERERLAVIFFMIQVYSFSINN